MISFGNIEYENTAQVYVASPDGATIVGEDPITGFA